MAILYHGGYDDKMNYFIIYYNDLKQH